MPRKTKSKGKMNDQTKRFAGRLVLVMLLIGIQPLLWQQVSSAAKVLHEKNSQRQQIAEVKDRIKKITEVNTSQKEFLDQVEVVVPFERTLPQVIERLEFLSVEDKVSLVVQALEKEKPAEGDLPLFFSMRVAISATGTIENLLNYLHHVEHMQELNVVRDISLTPATETVSRTQPLPSVSPVPITEPLYTLSMTTLFYFQPERDAKSK